MEFRFETDYDQETLTAMARGLRKTVRRKRSRRTHIFAGIVLVIGLASTVLSIASKEPLRARNLLVPLAMLCVIYAACRKTGSTDVWRNGTFFPGRSTQAAYSEKTATQ